MFPIRKATTVAIATITILIALESSAWGTMIARWTFNSGTSADLTGDIGGFTFEVSSSNESLDTPVQYNDDGTVTLGLRRFLYTTEINSTAFPQLRQSVTIYARVQLTDPTQSDSFYIGLINATKPQDYGQMSLVARHHNSSGTLRESVYGKRADGSDTGRSGSATPEGMFDIAFVYDSRDGQSVVRVNVNGEEHQNVFDFEADLQDFQSFAIGRLKMAAGAAAQLTFDEVHIYDTALTPSEIAEITPVPVPEPTGLAAVALGAVPLLIRRRRRG